VAAAKKRAANYGNQTKIADSDYEKFGRLLGESGDMIMEKVRSEVSYN
jgi:hypothetical protein